MSTSVIQAEWARRTVAEYRSAAVTQQLVLWLLQIGASPDLIRQGNRIVDQELAHAEGSLHVLQRAGGQLSGAVNRSWLHLPTPECEEEGALRATVELFCLGETAAVPLFRRMLQDAREPGVRALLQRILRDEAQHRQFGWLLLQWLLEGPWGPQGRTLLEEALPGMLSLIRGAYGHGQGRAATEEERRWGLLSPDDYRAALVWTEQRWFAPRFRALGFALD